MKRVFRFLIIIIIAIVTFYCYLWYLSRTVYPVRFGLSFSPNHATWLGLDWKETYRDILTDLKPGYVRVSAQWSDVEKTEGKYDFADVDFLMNEAKKHHVKVVLAVGQKAPRWPECYIPTWAATDEKIYEKQLRAYVTKVVERYRDHAALDIWQVENEPFIHFEFGSCARFRGDLTAAEVEVVKDVDHKHLTLITDSGELGLWRKASKTGDVFGTTLYRVVGTPQNTYIKYDWLPAGFYGFKAKVLGIPYERFWVSELQAEPWIFGSDPRNVSVEEMEKSLSPERLNKNISYVQRVGASRAYLWGSEWWYWMKTEKNDERYWKMVKEVFENDKKLEIGN